MTNERGQWRKVLAMHRPPHEHLTALPDHPHEAPCFVIRCPATLNRDPWSRELVQPLLLMMDSHPVAPCTLLPPCGHWIAPTRWPCTLLPPCESLDSACRQVPLRTARRGHTPSHRRPCLSVLDFETVRPPRLVLDWRLAQSRGMVAPHDYLTLGLEMEDNV